MGNTAESRGAALLTRKTFPRFFCTCVYYKEVSLTWNKILALFTTLTDSSNLGVGWILSSFSGKGNTFHCYHPQKKWPIHSRQQVPMHPRYSNVCWRKNVCVYGRMIHKEGDHEARAMPWEMWGHWVPWRKVQTTPTSSDGVHTFFPSCSHHTDKDTMNFRKMITILQKRRLQGNIYGSLSVFKGHL